MDVQVYLKSLPSLLNFGYEQNLQQNVYKALYYSLAGNGLYLDLLFDGPKTFERDTRIKFPWNAYDIEETPFYENVAHPDKYSHPPDRACGRVLEEGEWVYRCDDCGYDLTCVICDYCFNRDDHIDHSVSMYLSGKGEGICDCGDDSAFTKKLNCQCLASNSGPPSLPAPLKDAIHNTIIAALDYILDVMNFSVGTLPLIHSNINTPGTDFNSETLSNAGALPSHKYGGEDLNSPHKWYLLLWNDENHDYPEAYAGIRAATDADEMEAKETAGVINEVGRAILEEASSYKDLLENQKAAQSDGLVATICTARDYMREQIVFYTLEWLKEVSSFKGNMAVKDQVKKSIAELLLEPGYEFSSHVPVELLASKTTDLQRKCFQNGLLYKGELLNLAHLKFKSQEFGAINLTDSLSSFVELDKDIKLAKSRLQYLFAFEVRFTSFARKLFATTFLPILTSSLDIKAKFAEQYIDVFPTLMSIFAFSDREEELTSAVNVSLQLFTCPRTNQFIVESGKFGYLLGPAAMLMEEHSSKPNEDKIPNTIDLVVDIKTKRKKSAMQKTVITYMDVIGKILVNNDSKDLLGLILLNKDLYYMLFFLRFFQGLIPLTRKYGDHVERESLLDFVTFLQKGIPVLEIVKNCVSSSKNIDMERLEKAIKIVYEFLSSREQPASSFKVSKDSVSILNPVNSLLALLLQKVGDVKDVVKNLSREVHPFRHVSEYSLRSIVLSSQIKVGLWIRNGLAVSRQASYYSNAKISQVSYLGDFYLNQVALLSEEPESLLSHFVQMWQLEPWTSNIYDINKVKLYASKDWKPSNSAEGNILAYDDRWGVMCEQFILFLYNLLTNRSFFKNSDPVALSREKSKKAICDILCQGPKSYSDLRKEVPTSLFNDKNFDEILRECADFQPPTGFTDAGIYRLKDEVYDELDPFNTLDSGTSQTVYEALSAHNKQKSAGTNQEAVIVIEPKFTMSDYPLINKSLGEFTRTSLFAQLVKNLVEISMSCKNEEFLPHLLQLIHASLVDAEKVFGTEYLCPFFKESTIATSLFKLYSSDVSSNITQKARHLIEIISAKDESIFDDMSQEISQDCINSFKNEQSTGGKPKSSKSSNRKAKIMKKFEAQRKLFMENQENGSDPMDDSSDSSNMKIEYDFIRCVACGELQDFEEPFGIPLATTKAWVFCSLPHDSDSFSDGFLDYGALYESDNHRLNHRYPQEDRKMNVVGTSCGHGIHLKCMSQPAYDGVMSCPLCHNAHEDVIPMYLNPDPFSFLSHDAIFEKPLPVSNLRSTKKYTDILESTIHSEYLYKFPRHDTRLHPLFYETKDMLQEDSPEMLTETVNQMCFLISDTIQANEIALRMDGKESLRNLFKQSSAAFKTQIRSLIQGFAFFCDEFGSHLRSSVFVEPFGKEEIEFDSVFKEVVFTFLQTDYSLITSFRFGFAKIIVITLKELATSYKDDMASLNETDYAPKLSEEQAIIFRAFCKQLFGIVLEKDTEHTLFFALERCILPYLRCCALLLDIALSTKSCDDEFLLDMRFENYDSYIEQYATREYSSDPLCEVCSIPSIFDLMAIYVDSPLLPRGDVFTYSDMWFEVQTLEMFAQNYSTLYPAIKQVEYPNVVRLLELPENYNHVITDIHFRNGMDSLCLICGEHLRQGKEKHHMKTKEECSSPSLIFYPDNRILITIVIGHASTRSATIPGPYMTEHGEVATQKRQGKARLNHARYNQLNKMFINQDLFGYVTRSSFGASREEMGFVDMLPPTNMAQAGAAARMLVETFQDAIMGEIAEDSEGEDSDEWYL